MQPTDLSPKDPSVDPEMARVIANFNQHFDEPISLMPPILKDLFVRVCNRILGIFSGQPRE